jgi:hypothetical protein
MGLPKKVSVCSSRSEMKISGSNFLQLLLVLAGVQRQPAKHASHQSLAATEATTIHRVTSVRTRSYGHVFRATVTVVTLTADLS